MNLSFQRKVDRILGSLICRFLSLVPSKKKEMKPNPEKILVVLLSEMGSLVLAYPMFLRIREKYPHASIHVLMFRQNREILEILGVIPGGNILTINNGSFPAFLRDSLGVLLKLRRTRFDAAIDCELFSRVSAIFSFFSGAAVRVGFHSYTQEGLYRGSFINRPVLYNPYQHISQQFLTLAEATESDTVPKAKRVVATAPLDPPHVPFDVDEIEDFRSRLHRDFPHIKERKLVLLYPSGGVLPLRAWPLEHYCSLAATMAGEGYGIGIIGMKTDEQIATTILSRCSQPHCIDLTGYTKSLRELMILFHIAPLLITNDGGPGQFAAMTPIKTIIFYGPETPVLYGTLDDDSFIFYTPLSCSPCLTAYNHRNSPCDGNNLCLKYIEPEQVISKALEILNQRGKVASPIAVDMKERY